MVAIGLICSVRRQHLALFEGHCDDSLNRQSQRHRLLIHCADWVHCVAVLNLYFSLDLSVAGPLSHLFEGSDVLFTSVRTW